MRTFARLVLLGVLLWPLVAVGAEFKPYPGATLEEAATAEARKLVKESGASTTMQPSIYTTPDAFDKVSAFYVAIGKEYQVPGMPKGGRTLPTGQKLEEKFVILDGAKDLSSSKLWIKIQRPYIGKVTMEGSKPKYEDVRDSTAIAVSETK